MFAALGVLPRFFTPSVGGVVAWPGLIKVVSAGVADFSAFGGVAIPGLIGVPGCVGAAVMGLPG